MARATSDMNAVRMMLSTSISFTLDAIVFFGLALVIMLNIDATLTLYALLSYPVLVSGVHPRARQASPQES